MLTSSLAPPISAVAVGAEQQGDVVMGIGGGDVEDDGDVGVEADGVVLGKVVARLKHEFVHGRFQLRHKGGDTAVLVRHPTRQKLPFAVHHLKQMHFHPLGGAAVRRIEHMCGYHLSISPLVLVSSFLTQRGVRITCK